MGGPSPSRASGGLMPAVFLDRDGVLNRATVRNGKPYPPASLAEFELLPGVADAVRALSGAGYRVIVATNQPDVATGTQRREVVEAMHEALRRELPVDDIRVCWHVEADNCDCRKPKPGLLTAAARDWGIDLERSVMVGDRWRDVGAGRAAGCRTIFVDHGYAEQRPEHADAVVGSLPEAVSLILTEANR